MARTLKAKGRHIITSNVEHPAVLEVCTYLLQEGVETTFVGVDDTGMVRVDDPFAVHQPHLPGQVQQRHVGGWSGPAAFGSEGCR